MIRNCNSDIIMGHLEINGFEMHKGQLAEGKFEKKLFNRFETVFSGHFHHKSDDGQIYYLGTPYEIFGMITMIQKDFTYLIHLQENLNV